MAWNILWGFPGETAADCAERAAAAPNLVHLQPPGDAGRIWLERFSPLFARTRQRSPGRSYRFVYPGGLDLDRLACFFDYTVDGARPDAAYRPLTLAVEKWAEAWRGDPRPSLTYRSAPGLPQIQGAPASGERGDLHLRRRRCWSRRSARRRSRRAWCRPAGFFGIGW